MGCTSGGAPPSAQKLCPCRGRHVTGGDCLRVVEICSRLEIHNTSGLPPVTMRSRVRSQAQGMGRSVAPGWCPDSQVESFQVPPDPAWPSAAAKGRCWCLKPASSGQLAGVERCSGVPGELLQNLCSSKSATLQTLDSRFTWRASSGSPTPRGAPSSTICSWDADETFIIRSPSSPFSSASLPAC